MPYVNEFRERMQKLENDFKDAHQKEMARKDLELNIFRETSTPIIDRLKRLIATIPEEERNVPRSLDWYRIRLRGVEGRGAHAGQVGEALRELGYQRKRAWSSNENGFKALWYPPVNDSS